MCNSQRSTLVNYVPAELHENKEWYISYYVKNPVTNYLKRKVIRLNRIKSITERRKWAKDILRDLNIKLASGWNPYIESESTKGYQKLIDVMDIFIKNKEKELRYDSMRSYVSYIKILKEYLIKLNKLKELYVISFDRNMAIEFMQHCYMKNNISERSYNNYRDFYRPFFNWCIQLNYCKENPFEKIAKKKEKQKTRIFIDIEAREKLKNYLIVQDYDYFVICMLAYYAFLRPKEISYLRIKEIDLENQKIFVPGAVAKNGKDRIATVPNVLKSYILKMNLDQYDKNLYLFSKGWKPGKIRVDSREIARKWQQMRDVINIPKEMQFYSLRDTGITTMIRSGVSADQVRDQADHSSLEITNIYTKHANGKASEDIKKMCGEF